MTRKKIAVVIVGALALAGALVTFLVNRVVAVPVISSRPPDAPAVHAVSTAQAPPGRLAVTRIAHASVLIDFAGAVVLTDPWFTDTEEYRHGEPLGLSLEQLPRLT